MLDQNMILLQTPEQNSYIISLKNELEIRCIQRGSSNLGLSNDLRPAEWSAERASVRL